MYRSTDVLSSLYAPLSLLGHGTCRYRTHMLQLGQLLGTYVHVAITHRILARRPVILGIMKVVLVIDDSKTMRTSIAWTLRGTDVELMFAANTDDARNCLNQRRPDLMLIDAGLHPENGVDFCLAIKSSTEWATIPVILMTNAALAFDTSQAEVIKADGYIQKPFDTQILLDTIFTHLGMPQVQRMAPVTYAGKLALKQANAGLLNEELPNAEPPEPANIHQPIYNHSQPEDKPPAELHDPTPYEQVPDETGPLMGASRLKDVTERAVSDITRDATQSLSTELEDHPLLPEAELRSMAKDIIENIAWEVVPDLAETIIREEIARLLKPEDA